MSLLRPRPAGDITPPVDGLDVLSRRADIVLMVDEKLRLLARREQFTADEVRDLLLDVRSLANRDVLR